MGVDKLANNTPNAPKFICPNCLSKPKNLRFLWKKASLGVCSPCTTRFPASSSWDHINNHNNLLQRKKMHFLFCKKHSFYKCSQSSFGFALKFLLPKILRDFLSFQSMDKMKFGGPVHLFGAHCDIFFFSLLGLELKISSLEHYTRINLLKKDLSIIIAFFRLTKMKVNESENILSSHHQPT